MAKISDKIKNDLERLWGKLIHFFWIIKNYREALYLYANKWCKFEHNPWVKLMT